jgi:hypothetical protein
VSTFAAFAALAFIPVVIAWAANAGLFDAAPGQKF